MQSQLARGEGRILALMDPAEVTPVIRSAKRSLSPSADINLGKAAKNKRRKVADPLLILVQEEVLRKREVGLPGCLEEVGKKYEAVFRQTRKYESNTMETKQCQASNNQKQKGLKQSLNSLSLDSLNKQLNKIFAK